MLTKLYSLFVFFVPESVTTKNLDNREVTEVDQQFMIGFRTLTMIMGNWEGENPGDILLNMKRNMVTQKSKIIQKTWHISTKFPMRIGTGQSIGRRWIIPLLLTGIVMS